MLRVSARGAVAVIGAAVVLGAAAPGAVAAQVGAAARPGWRVMRTFGCYYGGVLAVTSTGQDGAWATGQSTPCSANPAAQTLIARWNGRSWQQLRLPRVVATYSTDDAIVALSGSYAWTFGVEGGNTGLAFLYRGGRWRTFTLPGPRPYVTSAVVFSRSDAWSFGTIDGGGLVPYAARFDGRAWRRAGIPVVPDATAAPAPRNIWALGPVHGTPCARNWKLAHWTGRWKVVAVPVPPAGQLICWAWVDWDNAHGAWIAAGLVPATSGSAAGSGLLLHWTGSRWIDVKVPFQTVGLGPLAHDGHRGLWIASDALGPNTVMVHYSPAHGWSKPVLDGQVNIEAMRYIPRTRSVWAGGAGLHLKGGARGPAMILKYGP